MADEVAGGGPAQGTYGRHTGRKGSSGFCPSEGPTPKYVRGWEGCRGGGLHSTIRPKGEDRPEDLKVLM